jgi:dimethylaniline monooxygenase (N-oxide forming)
MYSTPFVPTYKGKEEFKGKILHSSEYLSQKQVEGKRVIVVGGGKSALDIAVDSSAKSASSSLLFRNAHWGTPRNIAWLIPFQYVFLSRFGQALVSWYKGAWPTAGASVKAAHAALSGVMGPVFRIVEWLFALQLAHKGEYRPTLDVVTDFYGYAQVLDSSFKGAVAAGKVAAVRGEVAALTADGVRLTSGASLPCDVLVCATGFTKAYDYLPAETAALLGAEKDGLYLYRHVLPTKVADLAFVGAETATISNIATYGIQAEWLAGVFAGRVRLPAAEAMAEEVEAVKAWKRSWMPETGSRAALVLLHQIHYHDSLLQDMRLPHRRKSNPLAEIFMPYQPRDFAAVVAAPAAAAAAH